MKRLIFLFLAAISLPTIAGDLGPADLNKEQMSKAFPSVGTKWEAFCGTYDKGQDCIIELGENNLIVDSEFSVPYRKILRTEKWDTMSGLARLLKIDPAYTRWDRYRKTTQFNFLHNTVLVEYVNKNNQKELALFSFRPNQISQWYGFANAMRMISYGANPEEFQMNQE